MLEIQGKYNKAKIMIDELEPTVISQIYAILNSEAFSNSNIAIMPDCHAGSGAVIGFTMEMNDYVIPNVIGVDIGCGVLGIKLGNFKSIQFEHLDKFIRMHIPSGFSRQSSKQTSKNTSYIEKSNYTFLDDLSNASASTNQSLDMVVSQLGTLGGGNHFIEIDKSVEGDYYLIIHSGSRNFGLKVANFYQKIAKDSANLGALSYLKIDDEVGKSYLKDMKIAQKFAKMNRYLIAKVIVEEFFKLKIDKCAQIESVHNYIEIDSKQGSKIGGFIRKGAISAALDETVLIPLNMSEGTIIGRGKGNKEWNYSAPHGAGRIMSRSDAKSSLKMEDYKSSMNGIYTSCISTSTIDEAPMAYKNVNIIKLAIEPTLEILEIIKPVYNFKASEE
jgi:RNA-splicing ligase RtcB